MEFRGTERFELIRHLGTGGMGSVYQVRDHQRGAELALKTLDGVSPTDLYRFKREFRSLADLSHPNLVTLYELISEGQQWFFTMEYVQGLAFHAYLTARGVTAGPASAQAPELTDAPTVLDSEDDTWLAGQPRTPERPASATPAPRLPPPDPQRLRDALRQLCQGVQALHDAGRVHRDLKPSNVLVTEAGRVVILDFGLTKETGSDSVTGGGIAGTPAFMAPEQALEREPRPASDWYAVGTMLYQVLTGRVPFEGSIFEILVRKQNEVPPAPREVDPRVDEDLSALCVSLLHKDPELRPQGPQILERLGEADPDAVPILAAPRPRPVSDAFVGRQASLDALHERYARTVDGQLSIGVVQGSSGIGKTCLVEQFLHRQTQRANATESAVVLRGRCHERETVPYKAFDAIVDHLTHELMRLAPQDLTFLLPQDIQYLAEIFPVLRRVRMVGDPRYYRPPLRDAKELRNYAFVALRNLLTRWGRLRPLVLFIDDLQWADRDSFDLLQALLQQPGAPALLLLATLRPAADNEAATQLGALLEHPDARVLPVGPLSATSAARLAGVLLDAEEVSDEAVRDRISNAIARESGGNPFLLSELVHYLTTRSPSTSLSELSGDLDSLRLDRLLLQRLRALPAQSQRVLELLAVGGDPLPAAVLADAAELPVASETWRQGLDALVQERLVRQHGLRTSDLLEPYHDRVREAVADSLAPDVRRHHHRRLAEAIERWDGSRTNILARHWLAAAEIPQAKRYVREAAAEARTKLAFDRAAQLYRTALELEADEASKPDLLRALGDCLADAGRSARAAEAYQQAAGLARGESARALQHLAAEQYLRGGRVAQGTAVLDGVLATVGLRIAPTPRRATLNVARRLAWLKLRGTSFQERCAASLSPAQRRLLDILWSANVGLAVVDVTRAMDFLTHFVSKALEAGDPYRIAQGLALLGGQLATLGPAYFSWAADLVAEADVLGRRIDDPRLTGHIRLCQCLVRYFRGEFSAVADTLMEVEQHFLDHCHGVSWELAMTRSFMCWALRMSGRIKTLAERFDQYSTDAERTGDLYQVSNLRTYQSLVWLIRDDLERARSDIEHVLDAWPRDTYQVQHFFHLYARCEQALYGHEPGVAHAALRAERRRVEGSGLLRVSGLRLEYARIRGRVSLAMAETVPETARKPYLREARRCADTMIRAEHQTAEAMGRLLEAGTQWLTPGARRRAAQRALELAVATAEAAGTQLLTAASRHWLGEIRGDDAGRELTAAADRWMQEQGVVDPSRLSHALVPGYHHRR